MMPSEGIYFGWHRSQILRVDGLDSVPFSIDFLSNAVSRKGLSVAQYNHFIPYIGIRLIILLMTNGCTSRHQATLFCLSVLCDQCSSHKLQLSMSRILFYLLKAD